MFDHVYDNMGLGNFLKVAPMDIKNQELAITVCPF